jgi:hypothetical protein
MPQAKREPTYQPVKDASAYRVLKPWEDTFQSFIPNRSQLERIDQIHVASAVPTMWQQDPENPSIRYRWLKKYGARNGHP